MKEEFYIKQVAWSTHESQLRWIRDCVFIQEQHVPEDLEWDSLDKDAVHLIALDKQSQAVGCARVLSNGSIGRMAVLKEKRGLGIGKHILEKAITICQMNGVTKVKLSAQKQAIPFYENAGFNICSAPYLDANIWHLDMQLNI